MAHRVQWLGPAFAVAALMVPSVIALFGATSLLYRPPWLNAQTILTHRVLSLPQYALLTVGLSAAVVSCALATYRWSLSQRLLHLFLFCILLELFYRFAYGGAVSPGILLSVPETSGRETGELLVGQPVPNLDRDPVHFRNGGIGAPHRKQRHQPEGPDQRPNRIAVRIHG